jgi:hypothetical protein
MNNKIYTAAKLALNTHVTLDPSVPPDVGCAEAVSYILKNSGVILPPRGMASTSQFMIWLKKNGKLVTTPEAGNIVISPTGTSTKGVLHGHMGIVLKYGIASNDSNTGLFRENYTVKSWQRLFHTHLGFPVYFFDLCVK